MTKRTQKLALNTFICLMRATSSVGDRLAQQRSESKLTESQFGVLEALLHLGPMCQRDLGKKVLKSSGNMTLVIDNLEKSKLVQRQPSETDRRYTEVHLTNSGQSLIEGIFPEHAKAIEEVFSVLTADEQMELKRMCKVLGHSSSNE